MGSRKPHTAHGFTIVELLVVIVVIGILAAITLVAYTGISSKATVASLRSDLSNSSTMLGMYYTDHGNYPVSLDSNNCPTGPTDASYCLKPSSGNSFTYQSDGSSSPQTYNLYVTNTSSATNYRITNASPILATALVCPYNFIVVPGSSTYGTSNFCVMKYDASHSDATSTTQGTSTTPISAPSVQPWASVPQTTAIADAPNVANCTGCHLITEAEYLTIAQNVLNNPINWSSGTVGSGYIYSGHNDNAPANALAADPSDSNGYAGTGNSASSGANQKRTLTLSNGEVIWDMAGNVWEWTSGTTTGGQPGITGEAGFAWKEWTAVTAAGTLSPNPNPATTGISGASTWTSSNGIGQLSSYVSDASLRGFRRGGGWYNGGNVGVLTLDLNWAPSYTSPSFGFRVSR
jgi:prepilin-type N-terminal cleavage/methylation domain-containing protein